MCDWSAGHVSAPHQPCTLKWHASTTHEAYTRNLPLATTHLQRIYNAWLLLESQSTYMIGMLRTCRSSSSCCCAFCSSFCSAANCSCNVDRSITHKTIIAPLVIVSLSAVSTRLLQCIFNHPRPIHRLLCFTGRPCPAQASMYMSKRAAAHPPLFAAGPVQHLLLHSSPCSTVPQTGLLPLCPARLDPLLTALLSAPPQPPQWPAACDHNR